MKTRIVRIRNSHFVRIPKALLDLVGLQGEVDIRAEGGALVIGRTRKPREGWEAAFREAARRDGDAQIDDAVVSWEW